MVWGHPEVCPICRHRNNKESIECSRCGAKLGSQRKKEYTPARAPEYLRPIRPHYDNEKKFVQKLTLAVKKGNIKEVERTILDRGFEFDSLQKLSLNLMNSDGNTALIEGAKRGHINIVKLLIEARADPSIVDENNKTAAMLAEQNGFSELAEIIREYEDIRSIDIVDYLKNPDKYIDKKKEP